MTCQILQIFYCNEWHNAKSGKTYKNINPANEEVIADIQEGDKDDINSAVESANKAFEMGSEWRETDATSRAIMINKLADLIMQNLSLISTLESLDTGKPFKTSIEDVILSCKVLRYFAGWSDKICGRTIPVDGKFFTYTRREPVGVIGAIVPWNYPLLLMIYKLAPALATGCTIVFKPAYQTPLTALYIAFFCKEVGFPSGVINVVPGKGTEAGTALAMHPKVDKISFTGSTEVGKKIMEASAKSNLKRVTLELGGKSPTIVLDDVNVNVAVEIAQDACYSNMGECCSAGTRTFVQTEIYEEFVQKSAERARKLAQVFGDPFNKSTKYGPQISEKQLKKILEMIKQGIKEGAKLEVGGKRKGGSKGFYMEPTLFSGVEDDMKIATDEIFGPVQQILKFDTIEEVIRRANNTNYGLASGIITNDLDNMLYISSALRAGTVWVNCYQEIKVQAPFGGYKESGFGRELGEDCLNTYTEVKTVIIKTNKKLP
ncbi:aldehyde dehydrogenase, cytosolic 1-like isoform X1 [Gordionus sp. m RMFG-2023]|uniref:aldehyde dehydrogenase, cytosolic 1-like isoform X1 n=2 Tax=Gordionus sp. m RMFG-2023 TaxID=3053472 RepID=UPI0031FDB3BC